MPVSETRTPRCCFVGDILCILLGTARGWHSWHGSTPELRVLKQYSHLLGGLGTVVSAAAPAFHQVLLAKVQLLCYLAFVIKLETGQLCDFYTINLVSL